jgi:RNA polymerase sigma-70 factor, ECF subfamily
VSAFSIPHSAVRFSAFRIPSLALRTQREVPSSFKAPPNVDERELLERIRQGDDGAFDAVFRAHYPPLVGMAEVMLRSRAVAEEIVQDVMLALWRRRDSLPVEESLKAYLFRATRNRALNHLRHARVEREGEPFAAGPTMKAPTAPSLLVEEEIDVAVRQAIGDLPERCREVFELSRVHGLRYAEIASTLGISVKTVEAQMGKALRLLRDRLAAWLPGGSST